MSINNNIFEMDIITKKNKDDFWNDIQYSKQIRPDLFPDEDVQKLKNKLNNL